MKYGDVRLADELQFSVYNFELADVEKSWEHFRLYEAECKGLLEGIRVNLDSLEAGGGTVSPSVAMADGGQAAMARILRRPILAAYDLCLKCSHMFNILDARGAISVTERVGVIARVRALAVGIAKAWVDQQKSGAVAASEKSDEPEPVPAKKLKDERLAPATI